MQAATDNDFPYILKTIVGTGVTTKLEVNVPALEASTGEVHGIAQSKNGDLYFPSNKHVVLKAEFNKIDGTWSNVTIIAGTGSQGKGADNVLATESALDSPHSISLIEDSNGELVAILITEATNNRIRKLDMSTRKITTIAGNGTQGFSGDGGLAKDATFDSPLQAYYDKHSGDVFIVDKFNKRIRRVFESNGTIETVVGNCTNKANNGDGGPAIHACISPTYFVINDVGEWFIANDDNVRKVGMNGMIDTIAGGGTEGGDAPAKDVELMNVQGLDVAPSGELVLAEYGKGRVRKMSSSGFLEVLAGGGSTTPTSNGIPPKTASLYPASVAYTRDGRENFIVVHQYGRILMLVKMTCFGVKSTSPSVCSGHGSCTSPDQCKCNEGWMGVDCSITHCFGVTSNLPDRVCSGKGECVRHNKCHCEDGFGGLRCLQSIN